MGKGSSVKYPQPTQEERGLQQQQGELLTLQAEALKRGATGQQALEPYLYQQMGLTPQYDAQGTVIGFTPDPQFQAQQPMLRDLAVAQTQYGGEQLGAQRGLLPYQTEAARQQLALQGGQAGFGQEQLAAQRAMQPQLLAEMGLREIRDAEGNVTGFEDVPDPMRERSQEIQRLEEERSLAALRGELPPDPALMRDLAERESLTREGLRRQLGGGYATTTAGSEALGRFEEARGMELDAARRRDLTLAEQLGLARQGATLTQDQNRQALMQGVRPQSFMQAATLGGAFGGGAGGTGLPGGGLNAPGFSGAGNFGDVFSGFNQVMGTLGQWRGNQFQAAVSNQQSKDAQNAQYGQIAGTTAVVAAVAASSRTLKRHLTALGPREEAETLAELMGDL